jgi:aspartyl-tRNA(Asn)/glutamyl-tRNA(Gln) amidotransferase subunit B
LETFAKNVSNWMRGDLSRLMNLEHLGITEIKVTPSHIAELIGLVDAGTLSVTMAKTVLEEAFASGETPGKIVADKGYAQISDVSLVELAVVQAIEANPKAVEDYLRGKETAARFLVGQVMKITRGHAKPDLVQRLVRGGLEAAEKAQTKNS